MATTEIDQLKALTDGAVGFDDPDLQQIIVAEGSVKAAAIHVWRVKAGSYSTLVDVSESGSTRKLGDLQKNALLMADNLAKELAAIEIDLETPGKMTRRAVRR